MKLIEHTTFEGERACFALADTRLEHVRFLPGESALKHSHDLHVSHCEFMGKYPFWHDQDVVIEHCRFTVSARAAIWYTRNLQMRDCVVEAPKMFREAQQLTLERVQLPSAAECGWNCRDVTLRDVEIDDGDYLFMNGRDIDIDGFRLQGNYAFQDARNVTIRNAHLNSKDAFWNARDVTVIDSVIDGEYLGWHSKNLRLINCTLRGTQPLCYASDLVMENCVMEDTDLCFEYSTLDAQIAGDILSVKNPMGGRIRAQRIGELIVDEHCINAGACAIELSDAALPV